MISFTLFGADRRAQVILQRGPDIPSDTLRVVLVDASGANEQIGFIDKAQLKSLCTQWLVYPAEQGAHSVALPINDRAGRRSTEVGQLRIAAVGEHPQLLVVGPHGALYCGRGSSQLIADLLAFSHYAAEDDIDSSDEHPYDDEVLTGATRQRLRAHAKVSA